MLGIHNIIFLRKGSKNEQRPKHTKKSALPFIFGVICGALVVAAVLASVLLIMIVHHRKRKKGDTQTGGLMEQPPKARKMPRKMESANINATKFSHAGPLVLDAKLKGPVRHALEDKTTGAALSQVQFDPKLNEIVDIGTDIDIIKGASRMTTVVTTENQSARSMVPKTTKISDQLYTDKKKPKNEKATKTAALAPNPTAAVVTKPLEETKPKA